MGIVEMTAGPPSRVTIGGRCQSLAAPSVGGDVKTAWGEDVSGLGGAGEGDDFGANRDATGRLRRGALRGSPLPANGYSGPWRIR